MKISVVVTNWNGLKLLKKNLETIKKAVQDVMKDVYHEGLTFKITSKQETSRKHTIVYGGKEIISGKIGNFSIDLKGEKGQFDWDFATSLFRRLDIAEIDYEEKDQILQKLSLIKEYDKQVAYIKTIENTELEDSLFELLYSGK